jgi:hypothetical protein
MPIFSSILNQALHCHGELKEVAREVRSVTRGISLHKETGKMKEVFLTSIH